jgi:hypothetical protein
VTAAGRRKLAQEPVLLAAGLTVLAGVALALAFGAAPGRWGPVAAFAALWVGGISYLMISGAVGRRRARRFRAQDVPLGVYLGPPLWLRLGDVAGMNGFAAALATVAAAVGFPGVGVGLQIAPLLISLAMFIQFFEVRGVMFERAGLSLHFRGMRVLLPWTSITDVTLSGPEARQHATVCLTAPMDVVASVIPDTPRNRERARVNFGVDGQSILVTELGAGLDGQTLARAVREAMAGRRERPN